MCGWCCCEQGQGGGSGECTPLGTCVGCMQRLVWHVVKAVAAAAAAAAASAAAPTAVVAAAVEGRCLEPEKRTRCTPLG